MTAMLAPRGIVSPRMEAARVIGSATKSLKNDDDITVIRIILHSSISKMYYWRAYGGAEVDIPVQPGLVMGPVQRVFPISENDYAVPWDMKPE